MSTPTKAAVLRLRLTVLGVVLLAAVTARAQGGPVAEVRLGTDVAPSEKPLPMGSVLVGWRVSEQWSAGVPTPRSG